jgi:outer membrane receptor protein involved in Fe transport
MSLAAAQETPDQEKMERVEVRGPGQLEARRNDTVGKIVVGREELRQYGDAALSDVLKRQPGLTVTGNDIRMRGLGSGYTQILINGDPAPPGFAIDGLSPEQIERVEIMRTAMASSSAQAVAGAINIVLRKNGARTGGSLKLGAGHDQGRLNPAGTLEWTSRGGGAAMSMAATLSRTGTRSDLLTHETQTEGGVEQARRQVRAQDLFEQEKASLTPRLDATFDNGDTLSWQSLLDASRAKAGGDMIETTVLGEPTDSPNARWHAAPRAWLGKSDASWSHRLPSGGKLTVKGGIVATGRSNFYVFDGARLDGTPALVREVTSSASERTATSSGKLLTPLLAGHSLSVGWDGSDTRRRETRLQRDTYPADYTLDQDYTAEVRRMALFAQDEWEPAPRLQAYLGMRWEGLDTTTHGRDLAPVHNRSGVFSPVAQMLWKLPGSERDQLRLAVSRTYKAPLTGDLVPRRYTVNNDNGPTNPHVQGNPNLRPELAWGLDAAMESYFGKNGMVSLGAYHRRIRDVMVEQLWEEHGEWVSTQANSGSATAHGIEFDARLTLPAWRPGSAAFDLRANVTRNWSHVEVLPAPDNRLAAQIPLSANLGLDMHASPRLAAGLNLNYVRGARAAASRQLLNSSGPSRIIDVYATCKTGQQAQVRLSLSNLLHQPRYSTSAYDDGFVATARRTAAASTTGVRIQLESPL